MDKSFGWFTVVWSGSMKVLAGFKASKLTVRGHRTRNGWFERRVGELLKTYRHYCKLST
jgi:hypothetical protein